MSLRDGDGRNCFTVIWKIENMSYCWQRTHEGILSPTFVVDSMGATKWNLWLVPRDGEDGNSIGYYLYRDRNCSGGDTIDVDYELSFLAADGSVLNTNNGNKVAMVTACSSGFPKFEFRKNVFISRRSSFCPKTR
ncbi:speckle-type POZ protein B [Caerostris extrusa]|uniref:Speckle-type POZ protein B n=1 Tax=Caerostris extrusa TaxID=172846 RepID=A0AAV4MBP1_CAEEX|nr:speckle-type POZ protein B [Caerostris extrusa]